MGHLIYIGICSSMSDINLTCSYLASDQAERQGHGACFFWFKVHTARFQSAEHITPTPTPYLLPCSLSGSTIVTIRVFLAGVLV